jgi:hypothetical protein
MRRYAAAWLRALASRIDPPRFGFAAVAEQPNGPAFYAVLVVIAAVFLLPLILLVGGLFW